MSHHSLRMAVVIAASSAMIACSDGTEPRVQSGVLAVTKECSAYTGHAGEFCTITSSNIAQIQVGSRIVYNSDAVGTSLDTDIVLNSPALDTDTANGHCTLSLETGIGECTLSGGTGRFASLEATVAVSHMDGPNYAWDGTYSFSADH
jgi:hypothetical protein